MLSIENTPPDPPCLLPCEIPHLKSSSGDEIEKASHKLALPEVVDLSKLPLDPPPPTPLPNFSIRDYVFTSRNKDIKTNWPFSPKNLQLCLKHGVKDLLPPFQSLDTARKNQSSKRWKVETSSLRKENISNCNGEPSGSDDAQLKQKKVAEACIDQSSSKFEGENDNENDFPSTTTSNAQSEIGTTDILLEAAGPPASQKTENTVRPSSKKCRLIVKFGSKSSSTEDIASNSTALSETMASKVCPVCKTFSSSSNTTLNAHIDQCLSVESTPNWTADSKLIRHRIKPRKMRLMVDIYATAPRCTLEELDRRNGTSWATISSLPAQETEISGEGKKQRVSPVHPEDSGDVDAVYIDANGTKLRILSKFNDSPSVSKAGEDIGPTKPLKGGKGGKFLSTKKKKKHGQKHHKFLKLASQSKKFSTLNAHGSQIYGDHGKYNGEEESYEEADHEVQRFKSQEHIKASDSGTLRQWVGSKRTGLAKKVNRKDVHDPLKSKLRATPDLTVESNQPCLGESLADRSYVQRYPVSSKTPISSPEDSEGMENPVYEGLVNDKRGQSTGRERMGSSLAVARIRNDMERPRFPMKRKADQLGKNSTSVCDGSMLNRPKSTGHSVSLMGNKTDELCAGPVNTSVTPPSASTKPSRSCNAFSSKTMRHAKMGKNGLSIKKCSPLEKSQMHFLAETDEEVVTWHSEADQQYDLMHNQTQSQYGRQEINDRVSLGRSSALDTRQQRGATAISSREEVVAFKCSKSATRFYGHDEGKNVDSSIELSDDFCRNFDGLESAKEEGMHGNDIFTKPSSKLAVGVRLSKSLEPEFHRLGNHSKTRSNSLRSIEDYKGPLCGSESPRGPTGRNFVDEQDMFCADEVGNVIHGDDGHMVAEFDSEIGQGSSFPEVPIPGPPGSFLPSPGDMGSEDFQGNSSLTTSRVQSSQDQQDLVDGDSSDSPISAASTISNSMAGGANLNSSEPSISVGPPAIQDKFRSGFSGAIVEPSIENAATVAQNTSPGAEMIIPNGDNFNKISIKMGPNSFKIDDQPCCCQKKERISQAVALNYQESQLLRRRAMASGIVPTTEKQMGCSPNTQPNHFEARPEIFPLSSCTSSGSGNVVPSVMNCSVSTNPLNSPDSGMKFSGRGDCESASPSASKLILRLMGKNLMVVNKDKDAPVPAQSHSPNNHLTSQFPSFTGVSPGKIQNQDFHSFHHTVPQGSLIFTEDPRNTAGQYFDVRLSNSLRSPNSKTLGQAPEGMLENQRMRGGFAASMEPLDYQDRQKNRLNSAPTRNLENIVMSSHRQQKNAGFMSNPVKEIIVIDDVSETEADLTSNVAKHSAGALWDHQVVSSGNSFPTVPSYNLWRMNPFSSYHSQEPSHLGESPMVHNDSFPATLSRQANASPVKWSCTSEGSSVLKRSPFTVAPSSTGQLRSALYYSSSLL